MWHHYRAKHKFAFVLRMAIISNGKSSCALSGSNISCEHYVDVPQRRTGKRAVQFN